MCFSVAASRSALKWCLKLTPHTPHPPPPSQPLPGTRTILVLLVKVCGATPQFTNGQPLTAQAFQAALFVGQTSVTSTWNRCSFGGVNIDQTHSNVVTVDAGCSYGAQGCAGCGVRWALWCPRHYAVALHIY